MFVCIYCLQEMELHDGRQKQRKIDADDPRLNGKEQYPCDWCDEICEIFDLMEIQERGCSDGKNEVAAVNGKRESRRRKVA